MGSEGISAPRKLRFLCFHRFRTSAEIFKKQVTEKWPDLKRHSNGSSSLVQSRCNLWYSSSWLGNIWFPWFQAQKPFLQKGLAHNISAFVHTAALVATPITSHPNIYESLLTAGILALSGVIRLHT
ncbi:Uncharacterized protein Fot_22271 [Forsythia ovata]|uniref:Uncharacterized protein n=1 Tax=Forsythia ovata TaxID=205694 RepID=A0ABD1UYX5_9LAMI